MTQKFPPKPWNVDDTFTNGETGVIYVFTGEQWIASGGPEVEGVYLPLVGGKLSEPGNLNVEGQFKVSTGSELKVEFDDGTNFVRVRPDNGTVTVKGKTSVNDLFDVKDDVVEYQKNRTSITQMGSRELVNAGILDNLMRAPTDGYLKDYLPLAGGELTGQLTIKKNNQVALEIVGDNNNSQIKFWSSGAVALQNYTNFKDNELVTKAYVDGAIGDIDIPDVDLSAYLPLTGGQMTGAITSNRGAGDYALRVEQNGAHKLTIWNDGAVESTRTGFSDNQLVTKKYVDDNAGGITPGDQVAKTNGTSVQVGGFYISLGNLYVRVS